MRVDRSNLLAHCYPNLTNARTAWLAMLAALIFGVLISEKMLAQEATWIWSPDHEQGQIPIGSSHFRKSFDLTKPIIGEMVIAADDEFQVYFNNELVGYGNGYDQLTKIDLTRHLKEGKNVVAVRATNTEGTSAAMSAIMRFKLEGETAWRWLATDTTWKAATTVTPSWKLRNYKDGRWPEVKGLGAFGKTQPWDNARMTPQQKNTPTAQPAQVAAQSTQQPATPASATTLKPSQAKPDTAPNAASTEVATKETEPAKTAASTKTIASAPKQPKPTTPKEKEFDVPDNFVVQKIVDGSIGSIIALEFNEFGQIILSREGGKLLLVDTTQSESGEISVRKYCDEMENVQGILPLNGDVYVTGDGPEGLGLYRLKDADRDGMLEVDQKLVGFKGQPSEHGPHGVTLGPEGMLYVTIGNASAIDSDIDTTSPVTHIHEGTVLKRLEDPGGHAVGVKAPGGTIIRVSPDGSRRELFATGLRNAYDLAFDRNGELFIHDSDMESDVGTPWYRPTQVFHLTAGGEYGWRSGSAKLPDYYIDTIPGLVGTDRGSPSGAVVYDHVMMPIRYHGSLFLGDWSEGRIISVKLTEEADSYTATATDFLKADALTVTDLAVGPDGALYFSTGGRGTEGGVYRVAWNGQVPEEFRVLNDPLSKIVGRPQPQSAWARQVLAKMKAEMGNSWQSTLQGIALEIRNKPAHRIRALEILTLYGPTPSDEFLTRLATDRNPNVRRRAIQVIGWRQSNDMLRQVVVNGLADNDGRVRRAACESLRHMGIEVNWKEFAMSLRSSSRTEAFAARRLLESLPIDTWQEEILASDDLRIFVQGATAMLIIEPNLNNAYNVLARSSTLMDGFINDSDFVDLIRVMQLALIQGGVDPEKIPLFKDRMLAEFPSLDGTINREISRVIGFLGDSRIGDRIPAYLEESEDSAKDKMQVALNLRGLSDKFTAEQRLGVVKFLENMATAPSASQSNYGLYVANMLGQWSGEIEESQIAEILQNGAKWPTAALSAFYKLPEKLTDEQVGWISEMDRQLKGRTEAAAEKARLGCIAVLGRSSDEKSMFYLREVWRNESDRRDDIVMALAQQPDGENWPYLISSLNDLRDDTANEVLSKLATVNKRPKEPKFFRDAIMAGYRLRNNGASAANKLLEHWTGNRIDGDGYDWQTSMRAWAKWFNTTYPDEQKITFEDQTKVGTYSVDELLTFIETDSTPVKLHNGMMTFNKAQCANCHRHNGNGEMMGPDLSSLARRFSKRETLKAILQPSDHISSQHQAKKILTIDGDQLIGIVSELDNGDFIVLDTEGKKTNLPASEIDEMVDAEVSAMPEGLLDELTKQEIRDLVAYLYQKKDAVAAEATPTESR